MNILFISPNSPFESIGGIERYITNLITYYKGQQETKTIILLPNYTESYVEQGKNIVTFFDKNLALSKNDSGKQISQKAQAFSRVVENIIHERKIDIICAENFHLGLPAAYSILLNMAAGLNKIPLVLRLHSFATTPLQIELVNQLMWNKISCVSKSVAGDCLQKGADINILSTDYLGVNTSEFSQKTKVKDQLRKRLNFSSKNKVILTATRIIQGSRNILHEKGLINLIQAFSKLSPRYPDLRLIIAIAKPPDNLKNEFEQTHQMLLGYIRLHNIETQTIVEKFRLDQMPEVYRESDVFALPSQNETFGQVFIEAMSCGLPVIGTKVGGIPEIINDSINGYLIPPDDSSVLAQRIEKIINDRSIRNSFIKAGIKTVKEKFTAEQQLSNFNNVLNEVSSNLD